MKVLIFAMLLTVSFAAAQTMQHAPLTQQKMCADQAVKAFRASYGTEKETKENNWSYTSHFDPPTNICYVMTHQVAATGPKDAPFEADNVFDAFEGRTYATFVWENAFQKKDSQVPPIDCTVKPRGIPSITCHSAAEFESLVEKYFGIAR